LSVILVRFAPGYGVDERQLDPRLSLASRNALRQARSTDSGMFASYTLYLRSALHGDFGTSLWLGRPVASLLRERFPVTLRSVMLGILLAWTIALTASVLCLFPQGSSVDIPATAASGVLIALPTGVVAMFAMYLRAPVFLAIALVTFPKLFRYLRN